MTNRVMDNMTDKELLSKLNETSSNKTISQIIEELVEPAPTWTDEVSEDNPVLCWVSNDDPEERKNAQLVVRLSYSQGYSCYKTKLNVPLSQSHNFSFMYATPVKPEECYQGKAVSP